MPKPCLAVIEQHIKEQPSNTVTYFIPDPLKAGGRYETVTERIRRVDTAAREIVLDRKTGKSGSYETLRIPDVLDIRGELVDYMD